MVDIHSHILPTWDDGSRSLEESLEMLKIAVESGTTDIVATPHANTEYPYKADVVNALFAELKAAAGDKIKIHLGSDFHVQFENVQDALRYPTKYTINNGAYLMVELPDIMNFQVIREILSRLQGAGMVPVITHPERNAQVQNHLDELKRWVGEGCLVQLTAQSLLGRFGNTAASVSTQLLRDDVVHFVASDAHDTKDRIPRLVEAYDWVGEKFGKARADRLFKDNPAAVIRNQNIEYPDQRDDPKSGGKWWKFW